MLRGAATLWRSCEGQSDDALAEVIRSDGIDILIDCVGYMGGNRLQVFARKPAPIQLSGWGEPTGTGMTTMDGLLADPFLVPADHRALFSERVLDLPCFLSYWTPDALPERRLTRADPNRSITLGSFNRAAKITDATLKLWVLVMAAVPEANLLLKDKMYSLAAERGRLLERFASFGGQPLRARFLGETSRTDHFNAYQDIDIALDPMPHGGGMTTLDALWMGVPVVTRLGDTPSSRLAGAVLTALGLTELIATDDEDYVAKVTALATDRAARAVYARTLRSRMKASLPQAGVFATAGRLKAPPLAGVTRHPEPKAERP